MKIQLKIVIAAIVFAVLTACPSLYAQVNTEVFRNRITNGFSHQLGFDLGLQEGNTQAVNLKQRYRTDYVGDSFYTFVVTEYKKASQAGLPYINKGFAHWRIGTPISETYKTEYFVQKEFNDFIALKDRTLIGMGLRVEPEASQQKATTLNCVPCFVYYYGIGFMYEDEVVQVAALEDSRNIRTTDYITLIWRPRSEIICSMTTYFQMNVQRWGDYRILADGAVRLSLTDNLTFKIESTVRYDSDPPGSLQHYDLDLSNGIEIKF